MRKIFMSFLFVIIIPNIAFALPNPSAIYCIEHGGTSEGRTSPGHTGYGICKFNDGTECGDWEYESGKCKPGQYTVWEDHLSKDPDFKFFVQQAGPVKGKNLTSINYVDRDEADYYYFHLAIENINYFSKQSKPVQLMISTETQQQFTIPPLSPGSKSEYFDIFVPISNIGKVAEINANKSIAESDYSNNILMMQIKNKDMETDKGMFSSFLPGTMLMGVIVLTSIIYLKKKHN